MTLMRPLRQRTYGTAANSWARSRSNGAVAAESSLQILENQYRLDTERVLGLLGLTPELTSEQEFTIYCPFHMEGRRPNLGINKSTGLWNCWSCGAKGNLPKLVADLHQTSYREALAWLREHCGLPSILEVRDRNLRDLEKILNKSVQKTYPSIDISRYRFGSTWWVRFGGFDKGTVRHFHLGYDGGSRRAVIPIRFGGRWISIIRRACREDQRPRYLYDENFDRGGVLYAWDELPKKGTRIIIVEGPRDAIRLHSYGITEAVAKLGSGLTAEQLKLILNNYDEVCLWDDNDLAGHLATMYACKMLENLVPRLYVVPYLVNKKDPNELTRSEALRCLRAKKHWSILL